MKIEGITIQFETRDGKTRSVFFDQNIGVKVEGGELFRTEVKFLSDLFRFVQDFKSHGEEKAEEQA